MNSLVLSDFELPDIKPFQDEVAEIGAEFVGGTLYAKRAFARIARLIIENGYRGTELIDETTGEKISFVIQEDVVRYVSDCYDISRSSIMDSLASYRKLVVGLKMPWGKAFKIVATRPLVIRNLSDLAVFDRDGNLVSVYSKKIGLLPSGKELKDSDPDYMGKASSALSEFLGEASSLDNRRESARMVDETLGKNSISCFREGNNIVVRATERSISEDGESNVVWKDDITLVPDSDPPEWVIDKIMRRLGSR